MSEKKIHLRIVTPEAVKAEMDVDMAIMRCKSGDLGVMAGHENLSAVLDYGVLRIKDDEVELRMAVFGGIVQIADNVVTMLVRDAQWPGEINRDEAEETRRRIQEGEHDDVELLRDQVLLRRATVQLEVSAYPLLSHGHAAGDNKS